jgi:hypothetical protein
MSSMLEALQMLHVGREKGKGAATSTGKVWGMRFESVFA